MSPFVAWSKKWSKFFKISDEISLHFTHLFCSCYVTSPWLRPWQYQLYHFKLVVTWCTTSFNFVKSCILPAQCAYIICMDLRTNRKYFNTSLTDSCLWPKRNVFTSRYEVIILIVIQVCVPVGRVNVVWWVGLAGSCKGMNKLLGSSNQLYNGLLGKETFLCIEYTPFKSIKLIPCIVEVQVPWLRSQHPMTCACPKSWFDIVHLLFFSLSF